MMQIFSTLKPKLLYPALAVGSFLLSSFGLKEAAGAALVWGDIQAQSGKVNMVRLADFMKSLRQPLHFSLDGKAVLVASGHLDVFAFEEGIDPIQLELRNNELSEESLKMLETQVKWGTKLFFKDMQFTAKNKTKPVAAITIKIN